MRLVKIVRDKIGEQAGDRVSYERVGTREELVLGLRRKLVEEAMEYLLDPSAEELADVFEVAEALRLLDVTMYASDFQGVREAKRLERGGFADGIGMFVS